MEEEGFADVLLNMVLDEIDDLIIIHDSEHTVVWMNRAALKVFNKTADEVIGRKCYRLLGRTTCCIDCNVIATQGPVRCSDPRVIPGTDTQYSCTSVPYFKDGKIQLVVQHLRPIEKP
ncbi:MAG: PAS domain-containing protein [Candidatus Methanomethylophilaceae archaeon]|nr:hypothetical protein [Candidatus Methanomethylophilaceae archaeon]